MENKQQDTQKSPEIDFKIGKNYLTRGGAIVSCVDELLIASQKMLFKMQLVAKTRFKTDYWVDSHGLYNSGYAHSIDVIGVYEEEIELDMKEEEENKIHGVKDIQKGPAVLKPTNPKDAIGSGKLPIHLWPTTATALGALGLTDGLCKYGRSNYRVLGVRASIYYDAVMRHLFAWFEGEDFDPDSGIPHLGHALACLAIIVDSQAAGKLTDDRMVKGGYRNLINELTPHIARLKELHKDKSPKHYTVKDNDDKEEVETIESLGLDKPPTAQDIAEGILAEEVFGELARQRRNEFKIGGTE